MIRYEQENSTHNMIIDDEEEEINSFALKMLEKNDISGLLPICIRKVNNRTLFYYDITSKQKMTRIYEFHKISWKDVETIINNLDMVMDSVTEYMLDTNCIMLDPEYIYVESSLRELFFVYYPVEQKNVKKFSNGIRMLFDFILENFDHSQDKRIVLKMYGVYQKIVQGEYRAGSIRNLLSEETENFDDNQEMDNITDSDIEKELKIDAVPCELLEDEMEDENRNVAKILNMTKKIGIIMCVAGVFGVIAPVLLPISINRIFSGLLVIIGGILMVISDRVPQELFTRVTLRNVQQPFSIKQEELKKSDENKKNSSVSDLDDYRDSFLTSEEEKLQTENRNEHKCDNYSGDIVMPEHTMLLSDYVNNIENKVKNIFLIYTGEDKKDADISIEKFPCVIGSGNTHCDITIADKFVSHIHACMIKDEEDFYVEDMNSKNGTFVNEEKLLSNSRKKLNDNDVLKLAGLSYKVEIR